MGIRENVVVAVLSVLCVCVKSKFCLNVWAQLFRESLTKSLVQDSFSPLAYIYSTFCKMKCGNIFADKTKNIRLAKCRQI